MPHLVGRRLLTHPRVVVSLVALLALAVPLGVLAHGRDDAERPARARMVADATPSTLIRHTTDADFARGADRGVAHDQGTLTMSGRAGMRTFRGVRYAWSRWTSRWVTPGTFTELVPSWSAKTPAGTWIEVRVRVRDSSGQVSRYKNLGRWAHKDATFRRASAGSQAETLVRVATDTLVAQSGVQLTGYRVRVKLMQVPGRKTPKLRSVSAVTSLRAAVPATSRPLSSSPISLPVPGYSQMTHTGQNPEYGGGGEAWCSPTSLAMVLGYYGRLPKPAAYAWVRKSYADPWVNHLARLTYDYRYRGAGNWPFNTATAATRGTDAFVTRLQGLRMAERFVRAGIPLVVSIRFGRGQLSGAPISSTAGHLLVISGFTAAGHPIVMDPAAPSNASVRRTYDRAQFERAWLNGSGGTAYVIRDAAHPLPARPAGVRAW